MKQSSICRMLVALTLLLVVTSAATAADRLYIDAVNFEPGETKTLAFNLDNDHACYGFQADITLPEGLEILTDSNGKADLTLSSRCDGSYATVSNLLASGAVRLGAFSTSHTAISGNNGTLFYLNVKAAGDYEGGTLALTNILLVSINDRDVELPDFTMQLGTQHNNSFYIPDFSIAVNETKRIGIVLDNETPFTAFQTDVYLPEGLTIVADSFSTTDRAGSHTVSARSFSDGRTRISCFDAGNVVFKGNTGLILEFDVKADHKVPETCVIDLKNNIFSTAAAKEYVIGNSTTLVTTERALVQSVTLDYSSLALTVGETRQISAEVLPAFASTRELEWSSSNPEVASVSPAGFVTATGIGEALITATTVDGSGIEATCSVTVSGIPVTSITLNRRSAELMATETVVLEATVYPADASDKSVTWSCDNPDVATVDESGTVTAIAVGDASVTATSVSNPEATATCVINVIPTPVSEIILSQTNLSLKAGATFALTAEVLPETATDKALVWNVENMEIASVDETGSVTAIALGTTTVFATAADGSGVSARCTLNVVPTPPESISINTPSLTEFKVGETIALEATVLPEDASDKSVTWTSNAPEIVSVDSSGIATAMKVGEATIIAANSSGQTDEIALSVIPTLAENISVIPEKLTLRVGSSARLLYSVTPVTTTDQSVTWSISNPEIASIDDDGNVTALALGEATITATVADGSGVTSQCLLVVEATPATDIRIIYEGPSDIYVGQTARLTAIVTPEEATDKSVNWQVEDREVLDVDETGLVTAVGLGTAWVCATNSAGQQDFITFKVVPTPVTSITLDRTSISIMVSESARLTYTAEPEDATDKTVAWLTSDVNVATVDNLGNITGVSVGECDITAEAVDGSAVSATCHVTVTPIPPTSIKIDREGPIECKVGDTFRLTATVLPENASDRSVTWSCDAEGSASVDGNGVVTIKALGEFSITATNSAGQKDAITIKVLPTIAEAITLNRSTASIKVSGTLQLSAIFTPETTTDKALAWSSSDEAIAGVDENGLVTAYLLGNCRITATTLDGSGLSAYCDVTVGETAAESIEISPKGHFELNCGEQIQFTATVLPETTSDKSVSWVSQTSGVLIDQNGLATAIAPVENNRIMATNSAGQSDFVYITVLPIKVASISLNSYNVQLRAGESFDLLAEVAPVDASDRSIAWSSSDPGIATVDEHGCIRAIKVGQAAVTATANDGSGVSATCYVTVVQTPVENLRLYYSGSTTLKAGEKLAITAAVEPDDATDKTVTWTSSDESVASVNDGLVTALSVGNADIIAVAGNISRMVEINVIPTLIESIVLTNSGVNLEVGQTHQMVSWIEPSTATNRVLEWSSGDTDVVTVDENGLITAVGLGETVVTAATTDGSNLSASCPVWVNPTMPQSVQIIYDGPTRLKVGDSVQLKALVLPENTTDKSVRWEVQNAYCLNVTQDGLLTAVGPNVAWVGVTDAAGHFDWLEFEVEPVLVERIEIEPDHARLQVGETLQPGITIYPENASNKNVTWDSNDETLATVTPDGLITAMGVGEAVINVRATDGSDVSRTMSIEILPSSVEAIELYADSATTLKDGETLQIYANIFPAGATDKSLTWTSSNDIIASVSSDGLVTAHAALGSTSIIARAGNGVTGSLDVRVVETPAESILLDCNQMVCKVGDYIDVTASVLPATATYKEVTWEVEDTGILRIQDHDNRVVVLEATAPGETYLFATLPNGIRSSLLITVKPILVNSITLDPKSARLNAGETLKLSAVVLPENASDKTLRWICPSDIATIDDEGLITAIKPGTSDIIAMAADGSGVMQTCFLEVVQPVTSIMLSEHNLTLKPKQRFSLVATIEPIDATDKSVSWGSSDENVATVDSYGVIDTFEEGETVITVLTLDGSNLSDECLLSVKKEGSGIETITIDNISITIENSQIVISDLPQGVAARVYDVEGTMIGQAVGSGETVCLNVPASAIYILRIGNISLKIAVP